MGLLTLNLPLETHGIECLFTSNMYDRYIKIKVLATDKGIYEAVRIEEQANGSYLVSYVCTNQNQ